MSLTVSALHLRCEIHHLLAGEKSATIVQAINASAVTDVPYHTRYATTEVAGYAEGTSSILKFS
jgi:hypothetical protein